MILKILNLLIVLEYLMKFHLIQKILSVIVEIQNV